MGAVASISCSPIPSKHIPINITQMHPFIFFLGITDCCSLLLVFSHLVDFFAVKLSQRDVSWAGLGWADCHDTKIKHDTRRNIQTKGEESRQGRGRHGEGQNKGQNKGERQGRPAQEEEEGEGHVRARRPHERAALPR